MLTHPLLPKLRALNLSGMLETLEQREATAREQSLSSVEFLALLLDDELQRRQHNRLRREVKAARIQEGKTLARFDFGAAPEVPRNLLADLALCRFVERGENVLFVGPTGTGKSHLAQALVYEALARGYKAYNAPTHTLLGLLNASRADGTYPRVRSRLMNVDILVLDDFGLLPLAAQGIEDLYDIIHERYERKSILLTSNRACEEWGEVFANTLLASAALDRLTHHAHIIKLPGKSYRQQQRTTRSKTSADEDAP